MPTVLCSDPSVGAPSLRAALAARRARADRAVPAAPGLPRCCASRNDGNGQSEWRLALEDHGGWVMTGRCRPGACPALADGGVTASVTADGAYDGKANCAASAARRRHPPPEVIVAPRAPAVRGQDKNGCGGQGTRDRRIQLMAGRERMGWQQVAGHGRRNHAGTAMTRCMHLIGSWLRGRSLPVQRGEAAIAVPGHDGSGCKTRLRRVA